MSTALNEATPTLDLSGTPGIPMSRLVRTEASIATVLWQDGVAPAAGHPSTVTIDHSDGRLVVYLDAVPIAALDLAARSGSVGFALRTGAGGALNALHVAEPQWICWRGFGEEELRPAGTRLRPDVASRLRQAQGQLHLPQRLWEPPRELLDLGVVALRQLPL